MKNFVLGVFCGALGMAYLTGNLKFTDEGLAFSTEKPPSSPESPVTPPTVASEPFPPTTSEGAP
jgi:hypothetical protein